jgi:hypothetical protein
MNIKDIIENIDGRLVTKGENLNSTITGIYSCDLLSWVMSHAKRGNCWITVQTHINIVAVASLLEIPCIIVPEDIEVEENTINKAIEENIEIISTSLDAVCISSKLSKILK